MISKKKCFEYVNLSGIFIRNVRQSKNVTLENMAKVSGLSKHTIMLVEKGRVVPNFANLMIMFDTLEIKMSDFVNFVESVEINKKEF